MSDSNEISFERGKYLEKWALIHAKKKFNNPTPDFFANIDSLLKQGIPPQMERQSRDGNRQDFLNRALEILLSYTDSKPRVKAAFFCGYMSHITFVSENGKIFSWFEYLGEGQQDSVEILTYDYDYLKSRMDIIHEDLCKTVFHPKNQGKLWFIDEEVY
jgi:hypothetical protein